MTHYSKEFITLQVQFATRLVEITNKSWGDVLAEHTVFRQLLNVSISREDHSDPQWQKFVSGFKTQSDTAAWAYEFYQKHPAPAHESTQPRFGCFTFAYPFRGTPVVRLHFENLTTQPVLNRASMEIRKSELRDLFSYVRQHHPEAERVRGGSWLYHLDAYRRLFPEAFLESAERVGYETGFFALWGQFLRADGSVRDERTTRFLLCLKQQTTLDGCLSCFPYEVLRPECSIDIFYSFYNV